MTYQRANNQPYSDMVFKPSFTDDAMGYINYMVTHEGARYPMGCAIIMDDSDMEAFNRELEMDMYLQRTHDLAAQFRLEAWLDRMNKLFPDDVVVGTPIVILDEPS